MPLLIADVPENAGRDITTTANSDHKLRAEDIENLFGRGLTELVHLSERKQGWSIWECLVLDVSEEKSREYGNYASSMRLRRIHDIPGYM